jgi:hypothetical protein
MSKPHRCSGRDLRKVKLIDGKEFDTSVKQEQAATIALDRVLGPRSPYALSAG